MPRVDPDYPPRAREPRAGVTRLTDLLLNHLLVPLSLLAFWVVMIGSMVEYWAAH